MKGNFLKTPRRGRVVYDEGGKDSFQVTMSGVRGGKEKPNRVSGLDHDSCRTKGFSLVQ